MSSPNSPSDFCAPANKPHEKRNSFRLTRAVIASLLLATGGLASEGCASARENMNRPKILDELFDKDNLPTKEDHPQIKLINPKDPTTNGESDDMNKDEQDKNNEEKPPRNEKDRMWWLKYNKCPKTYRVRGAMGGCGA